MGFGIADEKLKSLKKLLVITPTLAEKAKHKDKLTQFR